MNESLQEVFRKGCLVDLNVRQWLAARKLQPEDLGLEKDEVSANFSLGHKKLIPAAAIGETRHWEYVARAALEEYSFPFPMGSGRYVPRTKLQECTEKIDAAIAGFNRTADDIVANYGQHRLAVRTEFVAAAHEAYRRKTLLCGGLNQTEEVYVNEFLDRIDKVYPTPEELRKKYSMDYVVFQVQLPDLTRATYADIAADADKINLLREAYTEGIRQRINSFAEQVVGQMRTEAGEALKHAVETFKIGKRVTKATLDIVRNMIDRYLTMDLVGDEAFKARLTEFKSRVLDMYKDKDIIGDKGLRSNVVKDLEALAEMAADAGSIHELVEKYRQELSKN